MFWIKAQPCLEAVKYGQISVLISGTSGILCKFHLPFKNGSVDVFSKNTKQVKWFSPAEKFCLERTL